MDGKKFDNKFVDLILITVSLFYFIFVFNEVSSSSWFVLWLHTILVFFLGLFFPYVRYWFSTIAKSFDCGLLRKIVFTFFYSCVCLSSSMGSYVFLTECLFRLFAPNVMSATLDKVRWTMPFVVAGCVSIVMLYDYFVRYVARCFYKLKQKNKQDVVSVRDTSMVFGFYSDWQSFVPLVFVCICLIGCLFLL